jgi:hypothetical protein
MDKHALALLCKGLLEMLLGQGIVAIMPYDTQTPNRMFIKSIAPGMASD